MTLVLAWYDDRDTAASTKITEAISAYQDRFGIKPNVVLVHPDQFIEMTGLCLMVDDRVPRHQFWAKYEPEATE